MLCCSQPSGTGSLSHGHFAGLYYWLIAFKLSPLRAPLPSGDCLVGRQGAAAAAAAAATQLCCAPPPCHVACIALSSSSAATAAADLHINHPGWRSKCLRGSVSRCLGILTQDVKLFVLPFFFFFKYILLFCIKPLWEKDRAAFHSCLVNALIHQQNDGIAQ